MFAQLLTIMEPKVLKSIIPNVFFIVSLLICTMEVIVNPTKGIIVTLVVFLIANVLSYNIILNYRKENDKDNYYGWSLGAVIIGIISLIITLSIYYP